MLNEQKNIAVFFNHSQEGCCALHYACQMAKEFNAYLTGICINHSITQRPYNSYIVGAAATEEVLGRRQLEQLQWIDDTNEAFLKVTKNYAIQNECRTFTNFISLDDITSQSFYCDVVVVSSPTTNILPVGLSVEQVLLKTGVPIIIVPPKWEAKAANKRVLIAWNASHVARRAVVDALPILTHAEAVRLLIVDSSQQKQVSGEELIKYLNHQGVQADIKHIESNGQSISHVIVDQAMEYGADLIVIGAYSRSRFSEMLLGGVTKNLLSQEISLPVFISR